MASHFLRRVAPHTSILPTSDIGLHVNLHPYHLDVLQQVRSLPKNILKKTDFGALYVNLENVNDAVEMAEPREDVTIAVHLRVHKLLS